MNFQKSELFSGSPGMVRHTEDFSKLTIFTFVTAVNIVDLVYDISVSSFNTTFSTLRLFASS